MAAEDVEAGRCAWEAFTSMSDPDEIGALAASWDPDVEYVEDLGASAELVLEDVRETPQGLVSLVRARGTSPSGLPFDHVWGYRFRMRDGRVVWFRAYLDPDEALGTREG